MGSGEIGKVVEWRGKIGERTRERRKEKGGRGEGRGMREEGRGERG